MIDLPNASSDKNKAIAKEMNTKDLKLTCYDNLGKNNSIPLHILKFTQKKGNCTEKVAWIWTKLRAKKGFTRCYTLWATRTWSKGADCFTTYFLQVPTHLVCKYPHIYETLWKDIWQNYQPGTGKCNKNKTTKFENV